MNGAELRHVALIMDGNGRWAQARSRARIGGHRAGARSLSRIIRHCRERAIRHLTLYAFSTENWARPAREVNGLMALLRRFLAEEEQALVEHRIELRVIGNLARLPTAVFELLQRVITTTCGLDGMRLTLALSYGAREELTRAIRVIAARVAREELRLDRVDEELVERHLDTAGSPPPDLIIRTGGEQRLSNFLLWQAAYSELYFTPVMWPDFGPDQLDTAIAWYRSRHRRFGLVAS